MTTRPLFRVSGSFGEQAPDEEWLSRKNRIWVFIALMAGLFVRLNGLGAQSLWNDEGTSVALARTSIDTIVNAAARDIHPPLYYLLLSAWIPFAGISEFALRFLSLFAGVLVIAVTFRIAREFFDQDVAAIATVLSALNPFQTYYAQETRMYIWVTLFGALSVWMMVRMLKPPRTGDTTPVRQRMRRRTLYLILYILTTLAALYTNYYAFTLVLFENLAFVAWLIGALRARRPALAHSIAFWIVAQVVIVAAYLPWIGFARQSLASWPGISDPMSLLDMTWRIVSAYATGADSLRDVQVILVAAYLLWFVGGLLPSRDMFKQSAWGIVTCALWAVVPLLAMYFVSLSRPAYNPKFLLLATPGFLIAVARGISVLYPGLFLRERAPYAALTDPIRNRLVRQYIGLGKLLVGGLFAAGMVLALQNLYTDPRLQRDDYRGIVNYINAVATDRDAVIVNAPGQLDVVRYYYHSPAQLVGLPVGRPMQRDATQAVLEKLAPNGDVYGIFWATEQADPDRFIEKNLAQTHFKASDDWHGNVRLVQYAFATVPDLTAFQAGGPFGADIELAGYMYPQPPRVISDFVPIELEWYARQTPASRYKVFAQLLDERGRLVSQRDSEPLDGFAPTNQWQPQERVIDRLAIPIPPGLAPGKYHVIVGMYGLDDGARLPHGVKGDYLELGNVQIGKRLVPREVLFLTSQLNLNVDSIDVVGYEFGSNNRGPFAHGSLIPLVLYFQANEKPSRPMPLYVQLWDQGGNAIASEQAFENYPVQQWDANEIVRDVHTLLVPQDALPGEYKLVVTNGTDVVEVSGVQVR